MAYHIKVLIGPFDTEEEANRASEVLSTTMVIEEVDCVFNERNAFPPYHIGIENVEVVEWNKS